MNCVKNSIDLDNDSLAVLAYVRRNLSACHVFVKITSLCISKMTLHLESNSLSIILHADSKIIRQIKLNTEFDFFMPLSISFNNCKAHNFTSDKGLVKFEYFPKSHEDATNEPSVTEAMFRLQIQGEPALRKLDSLSTLQFKNVLVDTSKTDSYDVHCANCKDVINTEPLVFESFENYSEKTADTAENFFCHSHDHMQSKLNFQSLYSGDIFYFLHYHYEEILAVATDNNLCRCKKCSSLLSSRSKSTNVISAGFIRLFKDKVYFKLSGAALDEGFVSRERLTLDCFLNIVQCTLRASTSKLYLESKVNEEDVCLLLWIAPQLLDYFALQSPIRSLPSEESLQFLKAYNVCYKFSKLPCSIATQWRHDFSVDYYVISDYMTKSVHELLVENSKLLASPCFLPGFEMSYLQSSA